MVVDRDYRLDEEVEEERTKLSAAVFGHQTWKVWSRAEIENYLISPTALVRHVLKRVNVNTAEATRPTEGAVRNLLEQAIEQSREAVRLQLIDTFERVNRQKKWNWKASTIVTKAEEFLKQVWSGDRRLDWCDAKEVVLPRFREAVKTNWNVSISERELIREFMPDEVPSALSELIRDLGKFLLESRSTRRSTGQDAEIGPLVGAMSSRDPATRRGVVELLRDKGRAAVPALCRALRDENVEVRKEAAFSLSWIRSEAATATGALAQALEDADDEVREASAAALASIGPDAKDAVPSLVKVLPETKWRFRIAAARALGKIGVAEGVVPALLRTLEDKSIPARDVAASALGEIGSAASIAATALVTTLREDDAAGQRAAAMALGQIGCRSTDVEKALASALSSPDREVRWNAARSLGNLAPLDEDTLAALCRATEDDEAKVREFAIEALGKIALHQTTWCRYLSARCRTPSGTFEKPRLTPLADSALARRKLFNP